MARRWLWAPAHSTFELQQAAQPRPTEAGGRLRLAFCPGPQKSVVGKRLTTEKEVFNAMGHGGKKQSIADASEKLTVALSLGKSGSRRRREGPLAGVNSDNLGETCLRFLCTIHRARAAKYPRFVWSFPCFTQRLLNVSCCSAIWCTRLVISRGKQAWWCLRRLEEQHLAGIGR